MRKWLLLTLLVVFVWNESQAQHTAQFLGVNPSVTVEPYYAKGDFDVNILPLVYQASLSKRVDVRLSTVLNFGKRSVKNEISHVGVELAAPIFLAVKDEKSQPSKGFFLAPGVGLTRNPVEEHNNFSAWLEPGYHLLVTSRFALSFGVQVGGTHFNYRDQPDKWDNHFGVKVIAGWWLLPPAREK